MEKFISDELLHKCIFFDNSEFKIWKKLDNGCFIGTLGYSETNVQILLQLLQSFAEQYGEIIDEAAAREELMLYQRSGKLFIYFDKDMKPISMNGVTFNEGNASVAFSSSDGHDLSSVYFYGLSTLKAYRGHGAGSALVSFAIDFARYNNFDFVYARTDLINSNSEGIMRRAGMEVCKNEGNIIAEWVDVTESKGDYRLHLWMPLCEGINIGLTPDSLLADGETREVLTPMPAKLDRMIS